MTHFTLKTIGECLVHLAKKCQTKPLHLVLQFIDKGLIYTRYIPILVQQYATHQSSELPPLSFLKGPFRFQKNKIDNRRYTCNYEGYIIQTQSLDYISDTHSEISDLLLESDIPLEDSSLHIKFIIKYNFEFFKDVVSIPSIPKDTLSNRLKELNSKVLTS